MLSCLVITCKSLIAFGIDHMCIKLAFLLQFKLFTYHTYLTYAEQCQLRLQWKLATKIITQIVDIFSFLIHLNSSLELVEHRPSHYRKKEIDNGVFIIYISQKTI